jgi:hypothetical protein
MADAVNPLASAASLKRPLDDAALGDAPVQSILEAVDAAVTVVEAAASNSVDSAHNGISDPSEPSAKRPKLDGEVSVITSNADTRDKVRGVAMIKAE